MGALQRRQLPLPARLHGCRLVQLEDDAAAHVGIGRRVVARLDLGLGGFSTWFTTENSMAPPHHIDMQLRDGPFRRLHGRWQFHALDETACKVSLALDFEPQSSLMLPVLSLGLRGLADRMVDDFVRVADAEG